MIAPVYNSKLMNTPDFDTVNDIHKLPELLEIKDGARSIDGNEIPVNTQEKFVDWINRLAELDVVSEIIRVDRVEHSPSERGYTLHVRCKLTNGEEFRIRLFSEGKGYDIRIYNYFGLMAKLGLGGELKES